MGWNWCVCSLFPPLLGADIQGRCNRIFLPIVAEISFNILMLVRDPDPLQAASNRLSSYLHLDFKRIPTPIGPQACLSAHSGSTAWNLEVSTRQVLKLISTSNGTRLHRRSLASTFNTSLDVHLSDSFGCQLKTGTLEGRPLDSCCTFMSWTTNKGGTRTCLIRTQLASATYGYHRGYVPCDPWIPFESHQTRYQSRVEGSRQDLEAVAYTYIRRGSSKADIKHKTSISDNVRDRPIVLDRGPVSSRLRQLQSEILSSLQQPLAVL
ncbi:hypothetical protein BV25DRAFT_1840605 [Artomyces pyxidatus]|uniref:Uncharacterized protein n=1 Tax=Artomyces pyxidatus TaxID=48021 RepID=A0ACB8SRR3_9AGAM|nr:hypothetical protein BV25DRAFT_1840605 [Artomyces pyxidatus]